MASALKFFTPLIQPLGMAWAGLVVATILCLCRRRWLGAAVGGLCSLLLWFISQPPVATHLLGRLERPWLHHTLAECPSADAVIVLGGGWRPSRPGFEGLDLTAAVDRWIAGVELCRRGRATNLVVGGDPIQPPPGTRPAAAGLRDWLTNWGLPTFQLESLGPVRTTRDEALRTRELVDRTGWKRVILVTSAFHMRRAIAAFEKVGISVEPAACDFQVEPGAYEPSLPHDLPDPKGADAPAAPEMGDGSTPRFNADELVGTAADPLDARTSWTIFPDEGALVSVTLWWHEEIGWLAYRVLGYR